MDAQESLASPEYCWERLTACLADTKMYLSKLVDMQRDIDNTKALLLMKQDVAMGDIDAACHQYTDQIKKVCDDYKREIHSQVESRVTKLEDHFKVTSEKMLKINKAYQTGQGMLKLGQERLLQMNCDNLVGDLEALTIEEVACHQLTNQYKLCFVSNMVPLKATDLGFIQLCALDPRKMELKHDSSLVTDCVGTEKHLTVLSHVEKVDNSGDFIQVKVTDPHGNQLPVSFVDKKDRTYGMSFTAVSCGIHIVDIKVYGQHIKGCPHHLFINSADASPLESETRKTGKCKKIKLARNAIDSIAKHIQGNLSPSRMKTSNSVVDVRVVAERICCNPLPRYNSMSKLVKVDSERDQQHISAVGADSQPSTGVSVSIIHQKVADGCSNEHNEQGGDNVVSGMQYCSSGDGEVAESNEVTVSHVFQLRGGGDAKLITGQSKEEDVPIQCIDSKSMVAGEVNAVSKTLNKTVGSWPDTVLTWPPRSVSGKECDDIRRVKASVRMNETAPVEVHKTPSVKVDETASVRMDETASGKMDVKSSVKVDETAPVKMDETASVRMDETASVKIDEGCRSEDITSEVMSKTASKTGRNELKMPFSASRDDDSGTVWGNASLNDEVKSEKTNHELRSSSCSNNASKYGINEPKRFSPGAVNETALKNGDDRKINDCVDTMPSLTKGRDGPDVLQSYIECKDDKKRLTGLLERCIGEDSNMAFPIGVTEIPSSGDIVVCDSGNHSVKVFSSGGVLKLTIGSWSMFHRPSAVVIDACEHIYVKDDQRIQKFDQTGRKLLEMGKGVLKSPYGLALTSLAELVTVDMYKAQIYRFSQHGRLLGTVTIDVFGQSRTGSKIRFLTVHSNWIVFTDLGRSVVYVTDFDGVLIKKIGSYGHEPGKFWEPSGVCVDRHGNILIADSRNNRVQLFSHLGEYVTCLSCDQTNLRPSDIHFTDTGLLLVSNFLRHTVKVFRLHLD